MIPKIKRDPFLLFFYKLLLICGAVIAATSFLIGGVAAGISGSFGVLTSAGLLFLWDLSLSFTLKQKKTNLAWETLLIFLRYGLLGGLFYAMISLLEMRWLWYIAGSSVLVPSLLLSVVLYGQKSEPFE